MFEHVTIRASDPGRTREFYGTVLATLGIEPAEAGRWAEFRTAPAASASEATCGLHVGFVAPTREAVDDFWHVGTTAGYRDDGPPGPRPRYREDYYGSFLLDPEGNSAEAVHHGDLNDVGIVDHLWIRVADVDAARRFYEGLAPRAGLRRRTSTPELVQFVGGGSSFSLVAGAPTRNLSMGLRAEADGPATEDPDGNQVELLAPRTP